MSKSNFGKVGSGEMNDPRTRMAWLREQTFGRRGQSALAKTLGIPPTTYAHYEKDVDVPLGLAMRLVRATRVNPRWLWHGRGEPFLPDSAVIPAHDDVANALGELLEKSAARSG